MKYTKEQLNEIKLVENVFRSYIKDNNDMELLWSDKIGYILLSGINETMDDFCMHPMVITDAKMLCKHLLSEIAFDIIRAGDHFHDIHESSVPERKIIEQAFQPYLQHLPGYEELIDVVFQDPFS